MLVKRELEHTGVEPEEGQVSQRKVPWLQRVREQVCVSTGAGVHMAHSLGPFQTTCMCPSASNVTPPSRSPCCGGGFPTPGGGEPGLETGWGRAPGLEGDPILQLEDPLPKEGWCSMLGGERPPPVDITSAKASNLKPTLVRKG